ncbi:hypothetical protein [Alicyclobacillus shizuokensis]|uniref:hypothetical protein n=1 Tax=Alicyclobacillus shizuokensis TaxID=392014 RepID=UPI0008304788|nr:hypothetical protein [Alicyclobacillus shizuokensis]
MLRGGFLYAPGQEKAGQRPENPALAAGEARLGRLATPQVAAQSGWTNEALRLQRRMGEWQRRGRAPDMRRAAPGV